ncbi:DgyrCDS4961 [Dimorphilus gyrociliatus]|uniref:DgyrCDS4961 n=1 Tax=Dimorphilus gyrociliatus TaxID=2664684 RepID=A0A7I8VL43_9ANNE|nr:DgyrCDS4961 [Dimorphilus gyrociliatus]
MDDVLFQLKFTAKQLDRLSRKAEKEQKSEQAKVKKYIAAKDLERAKIYAENAIRKKNESLNYLRYSAKVDGVASRVKQGLAMKDIAKKIGGVTKALDRAMASMDLTKISSIMEKFESQFEDLDVRTNVVEGAMGEATTLSTPMESVEALIKQVADENDLELTGQMHQAPSATVTNPGESVGSKNAEDALSRRLQALRN